MPESLWNEYHTTFREYMFFIAQPQLYFSTQIMEVFSVAPKKRQNFIKIMSMRFYLDFGCCMEPDTFCVEAPLNHLIV